MTQKLFLQNEVLVNPRNHVVDILNSFKARLSNQNLQCSLLLRLVLKLQWG